MPLFPKGKQGLIDGTIDMDTDDIRWMLVRSTYTYDATDQFVADLTPGTNDNGRSAALANKTVTDGVFDADDTTITATSATACNGLVLFEHTGSDATARVIAYVSISAFTPSAGQVVDIVHDNGANRIFAI